MPQLISRLGNPGEEGGEQGSSGASKCRAEFCFAYGELPAEGVIVRTDEGFNLYVWITLGPLPYTQEDSEFRSNLLDVVRRLGRATDGLVIIGPHQNIITRTMRTLSAEFTSVELVTAMIQMVASMRPALIILSNHMPGLADVITPMGTPYAAKALAEAQEPS